MYKRAKVSWMKHIDFILLDLLCIQISLIAGYAVRGLYMVNEAAFAYGSGVYRLIGFTLVILHFCIAFFTNSYSGILRRGYLVEFTRVVMHNTLIMMALSAFLVFTRLYDNVSRLTLIFFFVFNIVLMYFVRSLLKYAMKRKRVHEETMRNVVIVTTKMEVGQVVERFKTMGYNINIVGIALVTDEKIEGDRIENIPIIAYNSEEAYEYACRNVVDEVFIYIPNSNNDAAGVIANNFLQMGITVHINLDMLSTGMPNVEVGKVSGYTVMTTSINMATPFEAMIKRLIDIAAGICGCIVTGILYLFLAPAIKIADPGPVFFGQKRVGKNGRIFTIYKFRSMYQDAEERKKELMKQNKMEGLMFKMDADPRIIGSGPDGKRKGLGYWIRTLSLDEFPNFYSILKGDMSFVGTRPPTLDEYENYSQHHKSRLAMKPGLTGMWQVSGRSDMTNFEEIVALDTEYIKNWSLSLDMKIIFKTIVVVLKRKGSM